MAILGQNLMDMGRTKKSDGPFEAYINKKLKLDLWEESGGKIADCLGQCWAVTQVNGQYIA